MSTIKNGFSFDLGATALFAQDLVTSGLMAGDKVYKTPHGSAVDAFCSSLGLDPVIAASVKLGMAAATEDPTLAIDGGLQLASEVAQRMPAVTEYFSGTLNVGYDEQGHLGYDLKWKYEDAFLRMDDSGARLKYDGCLDQLFATLCKGPPPKRKLFAEGAPVPGSIQGAQTQQPAAPGETSTQSSASSTMDVIPAASSKDLEYLRALEALDHNWEALLQAGYFTGYNDNPEMDQGELQLIAKSHPNSELRQAAQFLLDNPALRQKLFQAHGDGNNVSHAEVKAEIFAVQQKIKYGEVEAPPAPPESPKAPPPSKSNPSNPGIVEDLPPPMATGPLPPPYKAQPAHGPGDWLSQILHDPNLSVEEKIMLLLQEIMKETDDEIIQVGEELRAARAARGTAMDGTAEGKHTQIAQHESAMEKLQLRLQNLMEKRKRMFDLQSTMSNKFHEMAKTAIQNMGRA